MQQVYFGFSTGLSETIKAPVGSYKAIKDHFESVTKSLELQVTQYGDNPPHWNAYTPPAHIGDPVASRLVFGHNEILRGIYADMEKWSQSPPAEYEEITPEMANEIWYGFSFLHLTYDRWTPETYEEEMDNVFGIMQGKEGGRGTTFDAPPLTDEQAAAVVGLFSEYLDKNDIRLELPNGRTHLAAREDYYWCTSHGPWHYEDVPEDDGDDHMICPAEGCDEVVS